MRPGKDSRAARVGVSGDESLATRRKRSAELRGTGFRPDCTGCGWANASVLNHQQERSHENVDCE